MTGRNIKEGFLGCAFERYLNTLMNAVRYHQYTFQRVTLIHYATLFDWATRPHHFMLISKPAHHFLILILCGRFPDESL